MIENRLQRLQPAEYPWLWQVFAILLITLLLSYVARIFLRHLAVRFEKTHNLWVQFHQIKQDVLLKILNIIHGHGADVAYPKLQTSPEPLEASV